MKLLVLMLMLVSSGCALHSGSRKEPKEPTKNGIRQTIHSNHSKVRACYKDAIKGLPSEKIPEGKVIYAWNIDNRGDVFELQVVSSTLQNSKIETCVGNVLKDIEFDRSPLNKTIVIQQYPFVFSKTEKID